MIVNMVCFFCVDMMFRMLRGEEKDSTPQDLLVCYFAILQNRVDRVKDDAAVGKISKRDFPVADCKSKGR